MKGNTYLLVKIMVKSKNTPTNLNQWAYFNQTWYKPWFDDMKTSLFNWGTIPLHRRQNHKNLKIGLSHNKVFWGTTWQENFEFSKQLNDIVQMQGFFLKTRLQGLGEATIRNWNFKIFKDLFPQVPLGQKSSYWYRCFLI
jgi:hypothetical protein